MTGTGTAQTPNVPAAVRRRWLGRLSGGHVAMLLAGLVAATANYALLRGDDDTTPVVVAARAVSAGETVTSDLFRTVGVPLDSDLAARVLTPDDLDALAGAVTAAPLVAGDPVRRSDLRPAAAAGGLRRMSIPVERVHAAGGDIEPGDRVDVVAVSDGAARYVLAGVEVLAVTRGGEGALEGLDRFAVTVAVDGDRALCVAEALTAGAIEVLVSTGARPVEAAACDRAERS